MDLSLWEPWSSEDCPTSWQMGFDNGDNQMGNYCFGLGRDVIEDDILNEKSCVQVLNIWIDKADDKIKALKEDIMMLKCQLSWDDEDWSRTCSAALREKIYHLDILVQTLKKGITEDISCLVFQTEHPENLTERLNDLLKPLLENYLLGKTNKEQTKSSTTCVPILPADGIGQKKLETCTSGPEATAEAVGLEKMKSNKTEQEKHVMISKLTANSQICVNDKLMGVQGNRMPCSAPVKLGGSSLKQEACIQIMDSHSKENTTQDSIKIQKASTYKRGVDENVVLTKPSAKISRKTTKITEVTESREALETDMNTLNNNHAKTISTSKPESKGPGKKHKTASKVKSSSAEKPTGQDCFEVPKKRGKNEAQQTKTDDALQIDLNSIPLSQKKRKSSACLPKTATGKKMKLSAMDNNNDPQDGTPEDSSAHKNSLLTSKDEEGLKLKDLRIIAKNQKLPGYYKLQKRELQERLGLEGPTSSQQNENEKKSNSHENRS